MSSGMPVLWECSVTEGMKGWKNQCLKIFLSVLNLIVLYTPQVNGELLEVYVDAGFNHPPQSSTEVKKERAIPLSPLGLHGLF